jgi:hypothetical protein
MSKTDVMDGNPKRTECKEMKKQSFKIFLILVLTVCIAMALPGLSAAADYLGEFT